MPTPAVLRGTDLTSSTAYPFTITVNGLEISQALIDFRSVSLEETASEDANGLFTCRFWDADNTRDVRAEMVVQVYDDTLDVNRFLGTVQRSWYEAGAVGRWVNFEAVESDNLLDRIMVPYESRPAEGTAARFGYFWGEYAKQPFSGDLSLIVNVKASLPADVFQNLTLRQAIRQIAGQSGSNVRFYVDGVGRPHLFSGTEAGTPGAAPSNINVAMTPGSGNIAPDDLRVERDGRIVNRLYVRGANAAGSGWFTDEGSKATYGPREDFLDAPSADTAAKAQALALLHLGKTAEPNVRGSFTTEEPNNGWRAGQTITITAAQHDLDAFATRIVKVRMTFTTGTAKRQYLVEFATTGARLSGMPTQSSVAIVGNVVEGTLGSDADVKLGNDRTYITSSGVIVNDGTTDRVVMGAISATDYGLKVVNSGATVIIDGTSNMFKVQSTGTLSITQADTTNGQTSVTLTALGALATTPAHLSFLSESNATTADQQIGRGVYGLSSDSWVGAALNGANTRRAVTPNATGAIVTALNGSSECVVYMSLYNHSSVSKTIYGRYYVLAEAAL